MFIDTLAHVDNRRYPPRIVQALDWLKAQDLDSLPAGEHLIDGRAMYAQVLISGRHPLRPFETTLVNTALLDLIQQALPSG